MLTGDKQETAVNISHSCGHFQSDMKIMYLVQKKNASEVEKGIKEIEKEYENFLFSSNLRTIFFWPFSK